MAFLNSRSGYFIYLHKEMEYIKPSIILIGFFVMGAVLISKGNKSTSHYLKTGKVSSTIAKDTLVVMAAIVCFCLFAFLIMRYF
jgi:hypothetical protein